MRIAQNRAQGRIEHMRTTHETSHRATGRNKDTNRNPIRNTHCAIPSIPITKNSRRQSIKENNAQYRAQQVNRGLMERMEFQDGMNVSN